MWRALESRGAVFAEIFLIRHFGTLKVLNAPYKLKLNGLVGFFWEKGRRPRPFRESAVGRLRKSLVAGRTEVPIEKATERFLPAAKARHAQASQEAVPPERSLH